MPKLAQVLVVIDMQDALKYSYNYDALLRSVNKRIDTYRFANLPIIFVKHNDQDIIRGSQMWQFSKGLEVKDSDLVVEKTHANAFYRTNLNNLLQQNSMSTIEFCGVQTEICCDATIKMAHGLGYKLIMRHDMTSTYDNNYMTAENTIEFYESIWSGRFLTFV